MLRSLIVTEDTLRVVNLMGQRLAVCGTYARVTLHTCP